MTHRLMHRGSPWRSGGTAVAAVALAAALSGCPTVDLGDNPPGGALCNPGRDYFEQEIWPNYIAVSDTAKSCIGMSSCHRAGDGRSGLRFVGMATPDPQDYDSARRFLNCSSPLDSLLLTKPLAGREAHAGGDIFPSTSDPAVVVFEGWFQ